MKTRYLALIVAAFLFVGLAGCFQTETWTTIDSTGSMERKIDIQIGKDSKDQLKDKKVSFEGDGWVVTEETKDDRYHLIATKKFDDPNKYKSPFDDAMIKLEKKDKRFSFSEDFNAKKSAGITDTARGPWKDLKYTFHLTMPGNIQNCNADKKDGHSAVWEFDVNKIFDMGVLKMTAESSEGGGICGSTLFMTGVGLGLFLFFIRLLFDKAMAYRKRLKLAVHA
jgi:hypothetical protein